MSTCIFETLVGSRAFGTHTKDSDWDYASVSLPEQNKVLGLGYNPDKGTNFTPTAEKDTTDHTFQKFISLALKNNPSILDILFSPQKHWKVHTPIWLEIHNGRHAFLSKSVATTYVGYARSQLKRIRTHREWLLTPPKHKPSRESFELPGNSTIPKEHREAIISIPQKFLAADIQDLARKEKGFAQAMDDWRKYDRWKRERNEDRAALEAKFGYDCYLDDTEFLTEKGWLRYNEIGNGVKLGTLDQKTGRIAYQHYVDRIEKPFSGQMGFLYPRHSNCAITLNHRMWTSPARRSKANGYSTAYVETGSEWSIARLGDLVDGRRSYFHVRLAGEPSQVDYAVEDQYLRLMGAYISDGCVGKRLNDGTPSVLRVSQKLNGRLERIVKPLENQYGCSRFEIPRHNWTGSPIVEVIWTFADRVVAKKMVAECGSGASTKHLPCWAKTDLSERQTRLLLDSLCSGDGTDKKFSRIYYTTSKRLADDIQLMCINSGIVSQVWGPYECGKANRLPAYQVYIGLMGTQQVPRFATVRLTNDGSQNFKIDDVDNVRIVCFTVPNETLITRRDGNIAIHGNTKHAMHLFRLLIQGREILETGELIVDRTGIDADLLRDIRHKGVYVYARLMEEVERMRTAIEEAEAKSTLPDKPDFDSINEMCIGVMKNTINE